MAHFRTSFLRDLLEAFERLRGVTALARLSDRLPERLRVQLPSAAHPDPTSTIPLDDAEEILLAIDLTSDPSGSVLELLAVDLASKLLTQEARVIQRRDLMGTVARMEAALMRPFLDAPITYEVNRTETGFALTLGIRGRPRSARILRLLALGFVRAADRFTLEAGRTDLRLTSEVFGDRATVGAQYRESIPPPEPDSIVPEPLVRSPRRTRALPGSNLSEEVERILSSAMSSSAVGEPLPRKVSSPSLPRVDPNASPPSRRSSQTTLTAVRPPAVPAERRTPSGQMPSVRPEGDKADPPKKA